MSHNVVIPLNLKDSETGETLVPVYKFQDAMSIWHEKELIFCTFFELYNWAVLCWNSLYETEQNMLAQKKRADKWRNAFWFLFVVAAVSVWLILWNLA